MALQPKFHGFPWLSVDFAAGHGGARAARMPHGSWATVAFMAYGGVDTLCFRGHNVDAAQHAGKWESL